MGRRFMRTAQPVCGGGHECGGTILAGDMGSDQPHSYCDRCGAFAYGDNPVPDGTDQEANQTAYDAGKDSSPCALSTLTAEKSDNGWNVNDSDGGSWWPNDNAQTEIATSSSPAEAAVAMCDSQPMRGDWHS